METGVEKSLFLAVFPFATVGVSPGWQGVAAVLIRSCLGPIKGAKL